MECSRLGNVLLHQFYSCVQEHYIYVFEYRLVSPYLTQVPEKGWKLVKKVTEKSRKMAKWFHHVEIAWILTKMNYLNNYYTKHNKFLQKIIQTCARQ